MDDLEFRARFKWAEQRARAQLGVDDFSRIEVNMVTLSAVRWHMTDFWKVSTLEEERTGIAGHLVYMSTHGHINSIPVYMNDDLSALQVIFEA